MEIELLVDADLAWGKAVKLATAVEAALKNGQVLHFVKKKKVQKSPDFKNPKRSLGMWNVVSHYHQS